MHHIQEAVAERLLEPAVVVAATRSAFVVRTGCLRVHGARGYKGALSESQLVSLRKALRAQKSSETYVMFNNTFFDPRSRTCTVEGLKIKYAAVCNAVEFTNLLRS